ncbi:hypothetical protein N7G274_002879 [Stereocaulon virgatum]|uniref:Uncharacterized protein n=1 Tax=Stereocaulon virgatum TaxID=373712 RepID=A0ABR4AEC7_9LECA
MFRKMGYNPFKPSKSIPRFFRMSILIAWFKRTFPSRKHQPKTPPPTSSSTLSSVFEEEERLCFRDSQLENYESTYKYLATRQQQQRQRNDIGSGDVELVEKCSANRTDIVGDNLWLWSGFEGAS